jgi:hypothetical protein
LPAPLTRQTPRPCPLSLMNQRPPDAGPQRPRATRSAFAAG